MNAGDSAQATYHHSPAPRAPPPPYHRWWSEESSPEGDAAEIARLRAELAEAKSALQKQNTKTHAVAKLFEAPPSSRRLFDQSQVLTRARIDEVPASEVVVKPENRGDLGRGRISCSMTPHASMNS